MSTPMACNKAKNHVAAGVTQRHRPIYGGLHPTFSIIFLYSYDNFMIIL